MRVLLALITVGITIYAFVDCLRCTDEEVRSLPRPVWLFVTLVPLVGAMAWLTFGRPTAGPPPGRQIRPPAPDDDPDFLQSLDRSVRERRRQAAEEARRRQRAEEARRAAEQKTADDESARGSPPSAGKPGSGKLSPGSPEAGPPADPAG
jgi:hypothetical protein